MNTVQKLDSKPDHREKVVNKDQLVHGQLF